LKESGVGEASFQIAKHCFQSLDLNFVTQTPRLIPSATLGGFFYVPVGSSLTRDMGKVLEQTGGPMSVRGRKKTPVIFLLGSLGIWMKEI